MNVPLNPMSYPFQQVPRASCASGAWIARAKMKPLWPHCAWPQVGTSRNDSGVAARGLRNEASKKQFIGWLIPIEGVDA